MNLFNAFHNASILKSLTHSICMALVLKHTKAHMYPFNTTEFLGRVVFIEIGTAQSIPHFLKS